MILDDSDWNPHTWRLLAVVKKPILTGHVTVTGDPLRLGLEPAERRAGDGALPPVRRRRARVCVKTLPTSTSEEEGARQSVCQKKGAVFVCAGPVA